MPNQSANQSAETQPSTNEGAGTQPAETSNTEGNQAASPPVKTEETAAPPATTPKTFTQDELNSFLAKQKKEWERKNKLSEDEKKDDEIKTLRASIQERDNRDLVLSEGKKLGVNNPDLLYKAVKGDLEFDDKGNVTNLTAILESAKTDFPQLFTAAAPAPAGSADARSGNSDQATLTKEQVENMTTTEINARWDEVSKFLSTQK